MNSTNDYEKTVATEIISELVANLLITRENLIKARKDAIRHAKQLDNEIKRIEERLGKEEIEKIWEAM